MAATRSSWLRVGLTENNETVGDAVRLQTGEEAGAKSELVEPYTMLSAPHVNPVRVFSRARLLDLEFKPGAERLEVAPFDEEKPPSTETAFRTVELTLRHWFADRKNENFVFHEEDVARAR